MPEGRKLRSLRTQQRAYAPCGRRSRGSCGPRTAVLTCAERMAANWLVFHP